MTDVITFSRPYAEAAYKVAVNDNTIDIWLQDMNILGKAVKESRVKALLASPKIKKLDKIGFLTSLTNNKNELLESFLSVLIDNKKIYYMDSIFDLYQEIQKDQIYRFSSKFPQYIYLHEILLQDQHLLLIRLEVL